MLRRVERSLLFRLFGAGPSVILYEQSIARF